MAATTTTRLRLVPLGDAGVDTAQRTGFGQEDADPSRALGLKTQHLLQAAAVLGESFPLDQVAEMFDISLGRALTLLDNAISAGLVRFESDDVVFSSAATHACVYDSIPQALRTAMHRQFGLALLTRGDRPQEAARQVCAGAREGDEASLALLDEAAQQLRSRDPAVAASVAGLALELTTDGAREWLPRCVAVVEARAASGQPLLASELARNALGRCECPNEWTARLNLALGMVEAMRGDPASADQEIDSAQSVVGLPTRLRDQVQRTKIVCGLLARDTDAAAASAADALSGDQKSGSDPTLAVALSALAEQAWEQGRTGVAVRLAAAAVRRLDRDPSAEHHPRLILAAMLTSLGDLSAAQACIDAAGAELTAVKDALWTPCPAIARARSALFAGRLDVTIAEAESALAAAEQLGTAVFAADALTIRARVALMQGDLRMTRELLARRRSLVAPQLFDDPVTAWVRVAATEAQDGPAAALAGARELCAALRERPRLLLDEVAASAWLTRLARVAGDEALASEVVDDIERLADANPELVALAAARCHTRALLDRDAEGVERAAAIHTQPWAGASAWEDAGRLHKEAGNSGQARSTLAEALGRYQSVGAERDTARVRSRLRRLGVRRSHGRRKERPIIGWDSLTESEQRVSRVIAEGLTTKQAAQRLFLSPHTVDSHVRHSFRKLGINSRVEMTRIVLSDDAGEAEVSRHPGRESRVQGMPRR